MYRHVVLTAIFVLGQSQCPYERPQDELMTCVQNMPRVDTGARPDGYGPPSGGEAPPSGGERRVRQAAEETEVVKQSTMPILGAPPILEEPVDYMCSADGTEMFNCTSNVYQQCEGHPGLMDVPYKPKATERTKIMCKDHYREFKESVNCMETSRNSEEMQDCIKTIQHEIAEKSSSPQLFSCSIQAGMFNCMVTHIGSDCGKPTVAFYIATLRTMEDPACTKIINQEYREPVSAGTQTKTSLLLLFISFMILFS